MSDEITHRVHRRWRIVSGCTVLLLGILLGVIIMLRGNGAMRLDAEWMEEIVEHRSPLWDAPARIMNIAGSGLFTIVVSALIVVVLLILKRRWTALFFAIASLASTLLVQTLKVVLGRVRPEDILLNLQSGSFPSGHVAGAATLAAGLAIILWRRWVVIVGAAYVILMALSRTYLGAHWVSDTVGGLLIGGAVAIIVWAPFAERMLSERGPDAVASKS